MKIIWGTLTQSTTHVHVVYLTSLCKVSMRITARGKSSRLTVPHAETHSPSSISEDEGNLLTAYSHDVHVHVVTSR